MVSPTSGPSPGVDVLYGVEDRLNRLALGPSPVSKSPSWVVGCV